MMKECKDESVDAFEADLTFYEQKISVGPRSAVLMNLPHQVPYLEDKPKPFSRG